MQHTQTRRTRQDQPKPTLDRKESARLRISQLRSWDATIQRVIAHDARHHIAIDFTLPMLHCYVLAELAHLDGSLGVDDAAKIERIVSVFDITEQEAAQHFADAAADAVRNAERISAAAHKRLDEHRSAVLGHRRLVDGRTLSESLNLTKDRKRDIFPRPRTVVDGKVVVGARFRTMLPTQLPATTRSRLHMPNDWQDWELPLAERRRLRERLGYEMATISRQQRTLSEVAFRAWIGKREAMTWPVERLEGRKLPGESDWSATRRLCKLEPKTRNRKPGVTAARREFATAIGSGMTKVKAITKGMSAETILALIQTENVTPATRYGCHVRPDKNGKKALFLRNQPKDSCSVTTIGKADETDVTIELDDRDKIALNGWYLAEKGKELQSATVRKWKQRSMVDRMLFAACEHVKRSSDEYPPQVFLRALTRIREFEDNRRNQASDRRLDAANLSSNLVRIYG